MSISVAEQASSISSGSELHIDNVLFVPAFQCNLISLLTLLSNQRCLVTLTDKLCVIQDRTMRTVNGAGEARGGVLWLVGNCATSTGFAGSITSFTLRHKRMDHPSYQSISALPGKLEHLFRLV